MNYEYEIPFQIPERQTIPFPSLDEVFSESADSFKNFAGHDAFSDKVILQELRDKYVNLLKNLEQLGGAEHWKALVIPYTIDLDLETALSNKFPGWRRPPVEFYRSIQNHYRKEDYTKIDRGLCVINTTKRETVDGKTSYMNDPFPSRQVGQPFSDWDFIEWLDDEEQQGNFSIDARLPTWIEGNIFSQRFPELLSHSWESHMDYNGFRGKQSSRPFLGNNNAHGGTQSFVSPPESYDLEAGFRPLIYIPS